MPETVDITPRFNQEKIEAYAEENFTRDPQTHVTARLEVLAGLAEHLEQALDDPSGDYEEKFAGLADEITKQHRKASSDLLGFFA